MQQTTRSARRRGHLSRHERQRLARTTAFSRRSAATAPIFPVMLLAEDVELIDRLVRRDRSAVSTALLAIAGIGSGDRVRVAVLSRIAEAAARALTEGEITRRRAEQIARHLKRARSRCSEDH